jgi:hypothetical protein
MAINAYMTFQLYGRAWLASESQISLGGNKGSGGVLTGEPLPFGSTNGGTMPSPGSAVFQIDDFSLDVEQTLNIAGGPSGAGAGAGEIAFHPFSITRKIDKCSPTFFQYACAGTPFALVTLPWARAPAPGLPERGAPRARSLSASISSS